MAAKSTDRSMTPSLTAVAFVKKTEALVLVAYLPTRKDRWTIGYGATGPGIAPGVSWSLAQAEARWATDVARYAGYVNQLIAGGAPTSQGQFDALWSFCYNVGPDIDDDTVAEGLGDSTLLKKHRAGDYDGAAAEFVKWNKQAGTVLAGLTTRRLAEAAMYRGA